MSKIRVIYVKNGIANRFDNEDGSITLEINENLKKYPSMLKSIIRHELQHTNKSFSYNDLKLDLTESRTSSWDILKFLIKYPRALSQFLPLYWDRERKMIVYDVNLCIIYSILIIVFFLIVFFTLKF